MRVVLDSNVLIAAFATRGLCSDLFELCINEHLIVSSEFILEEVERNLKKKLKLPSSFADNITKYLRSETEIVAPAHVPKNACRDKSDLKVLGTAVAGIADVIVTGDKDLLILNQFRSIPILSPRKFWNLSQVKTRQ